MANQPNHAQNLPAVLAATAITMSSREIAALTGKQHAHVMRDIRVMLEELYGEGCQSKFGSTYLDDQGKERACFELDRDHTMTLITGYNATLRITIIRRWQELEAQAALPRAAFGLADIEGAVVRAVEKALAERLPPRGEAPRAKPRHAQALENSPEVRFMRAWLDGQLSLPVCPAGTADVYAAFRDWAAAQGVRFPPDAAKFWPAVRKADIGARFETRFETRNRRSDGRGDMIRWRMAVPDDAAIARYRDATGTDHSRPPGKPKAAWMTESYFAFRRGAFGGEGA
jgi:phage regulator Rha-like protein